MPTLLSQQVDQFTMIVEDYYKAIETHETLVAYVRQQLARSEQGLSVDALRATLSNELTLLDENMQAAMHHSLEELKRTRKQVSTLGKQLMNDFVSMGCSRDQMRYLSEGIEKCTHKEYLRRHWIVLLSFLRTAAVCSLQSVPIPVQHFEEVGADTRCWIDTGTEDY